MVIGAFPVAKLGSLLLKQVSKPIAVFIKERAKSSPFFRHYVCMPPAQFYNWCEVKTKMWILNLGKPVNIPVLNETMAIELGSNLLGEFIIFVVAAGALLAEYNRSVKKEAAREAAKQNEINEINTEMQELFFQMEEQKAQMKELLRIVHDLEGKSGTSIFSFRTKPSNDSGGAPPPSEPQSPQPAPSSPSSGSLDLDKKNLVNNMLRIQKDFSNNSSLLMRAATIIETDFLSQNNQRNIGVLTIALNYLYRDVYNLQLSMY